MRILIDMDDVMADTSAKIISTINQKYTKSYSKAALIESHELLKEFLEIYTEFRPSLHEIGFFEDIPLMSGAQEAIAKLMEKHEVFVVSAATEFPNSMVEKMRWLAKYFPAITPEYTVFCGHKWMIEADVIIDDHPKNLVNFKGRGLLFNAAHNQKYTEYERVNSWEEVLLILNYEL
jgi:5'-nucleotidase